MTTETDQGNARTSAIRPYALPAGKGWVYEMGGEFIVNNSTTRYSELPSLAVRNDGALVVAWHENNAIEQKIIGVKMRPGQTTLMRMPWVTY